MFFEISKVDKLLTPTSNMLRYLKASIPVKSLIYRLLTFNVVIDIASILEMSPSLFKSNF